MIPPICLYDLRFRVTCPINNLPFFHGPQLSALFRYILGPCLPPGTSLSSALIAIEPVETGVLSFEKDDIFHVGISIPSSRLSLLEAIVEILSFGKICETIPSHAHFIPGTNIILEEVTCRVSERSFSLTPTPITYETIKDEIDLLKEMGEFSLVFVSPLRLPRPPSFRIEGHRYCDEEFFFSPSSLNPLNPIILSIAKRISRYFSQSEDEGITLKEELENTDLKIEDGALIWIDCPYGTEFSKTIGGVSGTIKVSGRCTEYISRILVLGQYSHLGKNTTFGFGQYIIPELSSVRKVKPLSRGKTLLERAVTLQSLKKALDRLTNSSPGSDGISVSDVKKAGDMYLLRVRDSILSGDYTQGELKKYRIPKENGGYRDIYVQCVQDRIIHKAIGDFLAPVVDRILHTSAWAYRRGLSRKGAAEALKNAISLGYKYGIKADIATFFDSVNVDKLYFLLDGLFPSEPLVGALKELVGYFTQRNIKGLPQGSPLSPVLSNLYLTTFDKEMEKEGFRLVRYCDDFVILSKDSLSKDTLIEKISRSLTRIDLNLKEEKIVPVDPSAPLNFLGYLVSEEAITEAEKKAEGETKEEWTPIFKDVWQEGYPVYLTTLARCAFSDGPHLVVKSEDESYEKIPWNRISRIVIVGRSSASGGAIYRAVKEEIPVTFIDILGRTRGSLYPELREIPDIIEHQTRYTKDEDFCLSFSREIISAKIHNSYVLLRRNGIESKELKEIEKRVAEAKSLESLRGLEGLASRIYFSEFSRLVEPFEFKGRVYHPPDGPINVLLSLGYSILYNRIASVLRYKGFNARLGFFHKGRGAHNALASDLMEELRHIAERVTLALIHLGEITDRDFSTRKRGDLEIWRLEGEGFRKFIHRFEVTMAQKASYHEGKKMSYNAYLDEMADNLKRSLKLQVPYKALRIN